jgi:cysteinyl-tRNA synthetase
VIAELNVLVKNDDIAGLKAAGNLLGILQQDPAQWFSVDTGDVDVPAVEKLLAERTQAKKDKNFKRADDIRAELTAMGIVIEDTPAGPIWRKAS